MLAFMKNERVSRWVSWVVGAEGRGGGSFLELKLLMAQRTIMFSLAAFDSMRSLWKATLC